MWSRYQSWGSISSMPVHANEMVVRITDTPREPELCCGRAAMIEQLVILRRAAADPAWITKAARARGDDACLFRVIWARPE